MSRDEFLCRICANFKSGKWKNLFEYSGKFLRHVGQLTGITLKNSKYLPQKICQQCVGHLQIARTFRKRCIKSQIYFATPVYKKAAKVKQKNARVEQTPANEITSRIRELACHTVVENFETELAVETPDLTLVKYENSTPCGSDSLNVQYAPISDTNAIFTAADYECQIVKFEEIAVNDIENATPPAENEIAKSVHSVNKLKKRRSKKLSGIREYVCDLCGSCYKNSNHFRTHLNRHRGIKPHHCKTCPSKFFTKSELKVHEFRHKGVRNLRCRYCDQNFLDYGRRILHERKHTNERPYACQYCPKAYRSSKYLKDHKLSHTKERPFHCTVCNKSFQRRTILMTHYRSQFHRERQEKQ